jgi:hypothetical protein
LLSVRVTVDQPEGMWELDRRPRLTQLGDPVPEPIAVSLGQGITIFLDRIGDALERIIQPAGGMRRQRLAV